MLDGVPFHAPDETILHPGARLIGKSLYSYMKRFTLLLCVLPALAFGQRFELSAQAGVSGNLVPQSLRQRHPMDTGPDLFRTGGLNPVVQVSAYYFIQRRFKLGPSIRYLSTSGTIRDNASAGTYRTGKLSNTVLQFLSECDYRFVAGRKFTFDGGVLGGPAIHMINNSSTLNKWGETTGSYHEAGFVIGMNFTGRYMVGDRVSVNLSANPMYNMLAQPDDVKVQYGGNRNYSTLCLPVTAGVGIVL